MHNGGRVGCMVIHIARVLGCCEFANSPDHSFNSLPPLAFGAAVHQYVGLLFFSKGQKLEAEPITRLFSFGIAFIN